MCTYDDFVEHMKRLRQNVLDCQKVKFGWYHYLVSITYIKEDYFSLYYDALNG